MVDKKPLALTSNMGNFKILDKKLFKKNCPFLNVDSGVDMNMSRALIG